MFLRLVVNRCSDVSVWLHPGCDKMEVKGRKHEDTGVVHDEAEKNICRDFLRNVCHRGRLAFCKFDRLFGM